MTSLQINPTKMLRNFLLTATFVFSLVLLAALILHSQQLQQGISVQMAPTHNAAAMPDADNANAWIVTVTRDGSIYFGLDKMTPESLLDKMTGTPRRRDARLYIKADARSPFGSVEKVLDDARLGFNTAVFLTSQPKPSAPAKLVPPEGLTVWIGPESTAGAVIMELRNVGPRLPRLTVDGQQIERSALKTTLESKWQGSFMGACVLKADGQVDFEDVVHVADVCNLLAAKVILPRPGL